jgi:ribosomal protein S18 acetylase RimI-like enzyme
MSLEIAPATYDDATVLVDVLTEATEYKVAHGDTAWGDVPYTEDEVRQYMEKGSTYVISLNNEPVGTFSLLLEDRRIWGEQLPNAAYLHRLAIKQDQHGQSLGEQLVNYAEQEAIKLDKQYLRLDCEDGNEKLCAYYEKLGFKKVGTKELISRGEGYVAALFEKLL